MTTDMAAFQALLAGMRTSFLEELAERCNVIENLILALENSTDFRETFNELYRNVHSLKGSGGTHGLAIITNICHHLENCLTEAVGTDQFDRTCVNHGLAFVDLLRRVEAPARTDNPDYTDIEAALDALRRTTLRQRKAGLIAESSPTMAKLYAASLSASPVQLTVVEDGIAALQKLVSEQYDFAIIGGELKLLNGVGVITAIRASQGVNQNLPALLVTSKPGSLPTLPRVKVIPRDQKLAANLAALVEKLLTV